LNIWRFELPKSSVAQAGGVQYKITVRHFNPMNNKLTLRMDESLIASAKDYAAAHGSSVSQMVANYFAALAQCPAPGLEGSPRPASARSGISATLSGPVTRQLTGILKPQAEHKPLAEEDYYAYLERKHLGAGAGSAP
jgi:Family of unknown function (DUF6364)